MTCESSIEMGTEIGIGYRIDQPYTAYQEYIIICHVSQCNIEQCNIEQYIITATVDAT